MGFRFRKSINLGGGTKINFSKSSVGISGGVKGFRTSINSKGRKTTSIGIPGSGISYVKTSKIGGTSGSSSHESGAAYPPSDNYSSKPPFYKTAWFLVICSIFVPPIGILLLWLFSSRSKRFKIGVTIPLTLYSIVWLIAVFSDKSATSTAAAVSTPSQIVSAVNDENFSSGSSEASSSSADSSAASSAAPSSLNSSDPASSKAEARSSVSTASKTQSSPNKTAVVAVVPKPSITPPVSSSKSTSSEVASSKTASSKTASSKTASSKASASPAHTLKSTAVPGTVQNGEHATLTIVGKPNTKYTISVYYSSGASKADGLEAKTSDGSGNVSWTWKVGTKTTPGKHRIVISGGGEQIESSITTVK